MKELQEFERVELISKYIDGVTSKKEKDLAENLLITDESFLRTFLETYEFLETLRNIRKELDT